MKQVRAEKTITLALIVLLLLTLISYVPPSVKAESFVVSVNYERVYIIFQAGNLVQKLYVSITPSLYDYYKGKNHGLYDVNSYNKFITPEAVKPIAEELRKVFRDDEQFANSVLSLVHKMKYVRSGPKYPVETLVENAGDCSALSFLAASIMIAGGLDVVLLRYSGDNIEHLNVGVFLLHAPIYHTWWVSSKGYEYEGKKYWMAECTPSWINWRVGDEPESLQDTKARVITIDSWGESPSCVSASLNFPLKPSIISIDLPPQTPVIINNVYSVQISGAIIPETTGVKVVAYVNRNGFSWEFSTAAWVDELGRYTLVCNLTSPGTYYIRVSWNGSKGYSGADSPVLMLFVGPSSLTQFSGPGFNYIYSRIGLSKYEVYKGVGADEFLNFQLVGDRILIAAEFMLLKGESMTVLESQMSSKILEGLEPLRLPNDFDLKVRDTFAFTLSKYDYNYSVYVRGLSLYDVLNMSQLNDGEALVLNASSSVRDNSWYSFVLEIGGNVTSFELREINGAPLKVFSADNTTAKTFVIILASIKDSIIIFKNLKMETFDDFLKPEGDNFAPSFLLYYMVFFTSLTILVLVATTVHVYKRKRETFEVAGFITFTFN